MKPSFPSNGEKGNTEGRRVLMDPTILAYVAGFLDGDGSIFFQLVRRSDYLFGFQVRCSIAFYQKTEKAEILEWLHEVFKKGYIRHRKTGISDYTIVEPVEVQSILLLLGAHVRLKHEQVVLGVKILENLQHVSDAQKFLHVCRMVDRFKELNYSKKRKISSLDVQKFLEQHHFIAPVETDSERMRVVPEIGMAQTPTASSAGRG